MATRKYNAHINLNQNEIQNAVAQNLASSPNNPKEGQEYYDTTDKAKYIWNGTGWVSETAQGTAYVEGNGIDITGNTISVDLQASDIPNLSLSKITDVTATASEVNVLDGITVTTAQLNSVTSKIGLSDLSIASGSANYLGYNNSNGQFSAKVDTTVGTVSTNLVTSGAVQTAINNAISNVYKAQGTVAFASLPTLGSSIEGYVYNISDAFTTTSDFVEGSGKSYPAGTNVVCINTSGTTYKWDVLAGSVDTSSFITASSTNTLTNKTIDADDNTISDLATGNFKSGVIVTSVGSTGTDTSIPTEKAVRSAITTATSGVTKKLTVNNPSLTASSGQCTWTITNTLGTDDVAISIKEISSGSEVYCEIVYGTGTITVKINSSSNISADTYKAVIIG